MLLLLEINNNNDSKNKKRDIIDMSVVGEEWVKEKEGERERFHAERPYVIVILNLDHNNVQF